MFTLTFHFFVAGALVGCHSSNSAQVAPPTSAPSNVLPSDLADDWSKMASITPRVYACTKATSPIQIDGNPDDPAWGMATWTEDFVDIQGPRRPAPRFRTRAKMLWDDQNLYVFAQLDEPHVWGTITKKNTVMFHDPDFEIFIDPDGDHHNYYEFEMNAQNSVWELTLAKPYRDGGPTIDPTNIEGLRSAVHVDGTINDPSDTDKSWSVEIAIPWDGLKRYANGKSMPPKDGDFWRMNFSRVEWLTDIIDGHYRKIPPENRPEDNWVWSPTGVIDMHRPEKWGYVQFSAGDHPAAAREVETDIRAHDALMLVYYRQRMFRERFGRFAGTLEELGINASTESALSVNPISLTDDGYTASVTVSGIKGPERKFYIRQDSKFWSN